MTTAFNVLVLLPSMLLAFFVLTTFYGARRAYLALCWIPGTLFLLVATFQELGPLTAAQDYWLGELCKALVWASLVQGGIGVGLIVRAVRRRQGYIGLAAATCLALLPFILRV